MRLRGTGPHRQRQAEAFRAAIEAAARRAFGDCRGVDLEARFAGEDDWQLDIVRGEFRASVRVRIERGQDGQPRCVRYGTKMETKSLARWAEARDRWVRRGARAGRAAGLGAFATMCWLVVGVHAPVFVLGGLLMVVVLLVAFFGGATAGEWIAEGLAAARLDAVRRQLARDGVLRADLRRLRSMSRSIARARRRLEASADPHPFRAEGQSEEMAPTAC